jgi:hypothetical protein
VREDEIGESRVQRKQARGKRRLAIGRYATIGDVRQPVSVRRNETPACGAEAGVKPEKDQPSFSITSSETS